MDRGAWWAAVHGVAKRWRWLSKHAHTHLFLPLVKCAVFHTYFIPIFIFLYKYFVLIFHVIRATSDLEIFIHRDIHSTSIHQMA